MKVTWSFMLMPLTQFLCDLEQFTQILKFPLSWFVKGSDSESLISKNSRQFTHPVNKLQNFKSCPSIIPYPYARICALTWKVRKFWKYRDFWFDCKSGMYMWTFQDSLHLPKFTCFIFMEFLLLILNPSNIY